MNRSLATTLAAALRPVEPEPEERRQLVRLMTLLGGLEAGSGLASLFPQYEDLRGRFLAAAACGDGEEIEERFLELYAYLHMHEAPYTPRERCLLDASGGYWCHAGGLSPLLRAAPFIAPATVSADLGAGNGLQGLLLQALYPHRLTIQLEISAAMVDIGRTLQAWLGIPDHSVRWLVTNLMDADLDRLGVDIDFLYLYRPVRPHGRGRTFYSRLAAHLERSRTSVIFSVADCLDEFMGDGFEPFYDDGHLTCYRHR